MLDVRKKARFTWHCRRGMLELDLILQQFLDHGFDQLSDTEVNVFDNLLSYTDPELFAWLMGHEDPQDKELYHLVTLIRNNN